MRLDRYRNISRKHGKIPDTDSDLLHVVWEVRIVKEELEQVLTAKKLIVWPQNEKEKEAAPKGRPEQ